MSRVLQVLEICKIWICHIFEFYWLPKVTSTLSKRSTEHDGVVIRVGDIVLVGGKDKAYINCSSKYDYVTVCYLVSGES